MSIDKDPIKLFETMEKELTQMEFEQVISKWQNTMDSMIGTNYTKANTKGLQAPVNSSAVVKRRRIM